MANRLPEATAGQIVGSYLPKGWKFRSPPSFVRGRGGACDYRRRTIYGPRVVDDYTLAVFLHEIGHATLHKHAEQAPHLQEFEAERYAMGELRKLGLPVTREILLEAKDNVRASIAADRKSGRKIGHKARRWAR